MSKVIAKVFFLKKQHFKQNIPQFPRNIQMKKRFFFVVPEPYNYEKL